MPTEGGGEGGGGEGREEEGREEEGGEEGESTIAATEQSHRRVWWL